MKLTGAAILVSRGIAFLQAAPAAYPYRSAARDGLHDGDTMTSQNDTCSQRHDKVRKLLTLVIGSAFGPVDPLSLQEILPVHDEVHVSIHAIRPTESHPYLTLFTTGMSNVAMEVPAGQEEWQYAELIMHLPSTWPHPRDHAEDPAVFWPVQWLRKVAYYPHLNETWLGGPATIISSAEPPAPLGPNTKHSCLLLLADAGNFPALNVGDGKIVHMYTVTTLHTEERDYERTHSFKELLQAVSREWRDKYGECSSQMCDCQI